MPPEKIENRTIAQALSRGEAPPLEPGKAFRLIRPYFVQESGLPHSRISVNENKGTAPQLARAHGLSDYFAFPLAAHERRHHVLKTAICTALCSCLDQFEDSKRILFSLHANRLQRTKLENAVCWSICALRY